MKLKFSVGTCYVGSDVKEELEIIDEELEGKSESEVEAYIKEIFQQWVWENIDCGWEKVD